jgi:hypothetical protein
VLATDYTILCGNPGGNSKTMTLPAASANLGKIFVFKQVAGTPGTCVVSGIAAGDGGPNISLGLPGSGSTNAITIQSDGTSWWVLSRSN